MMCVKLVAHCHNKIITASNIRFNNYYLTFSAILFGLHQSKIFSSLPCKNSNVTIKNISDVKNYCFITILNCCTKTKNIFTLLQKTIRSNIFYQLYFNKKLIVCTIITDADCLESEPKYCRNNRQ